MSYNLGLYQNQTQFYGDLRTRFRCFINVRPAILIDWNSICEYLQTGAAKDVITVWIWIRLRNWSDCAYSETIKTVSQSLQVVTMLQSKQWRQIRPIPMNSVTDCSNHCNFSANSTSNLFVIMLRDILNHNSPLCETLNLRERHQTHFVVFWLCTYRHDTNNLHLPIKQQILKTM